MDDEAMLQMDEGLAAAVRAASDSKPNSKDRRQQLLNFKYRLVTALSSSPCAMTQ